MQQATGSETYGRGAWRGPFAGVVRGTGSLAKAYASLVLGMLSVHAGVLFGMPVGVVVNVTLGICAVAVGVAARRQMARTQDFDGSAVALAGCVLGAVCPAIVLTLVVTDDSVFAGVDNGLVVVPAIVGLLTAVALRFPIALADDPATAASQRSAMRERCRESVGSGLRAALGDPVNALRCVVHCSQESYADVAGRFREPNARHASIPLEDLRLAAQTSLLGCVLTAFAALCFAAASRRGFGASLGDGALGTAWSADWLMLGVLLVCALAVAGFGLVMAVGVATMQSGGRAPSRLWHSVCASQPVTMLCAGIVPAVFAVALIALAIALVLTMVLILIAGYLVLADG